MAIVCGNVNVSDRIVAIVASPTCYSASKNGVQGPNIVESYLSIPDGQTEVPKLSSHNIDTTRNVDVNGCFLLFIQLATLRPHAEGRYFAFKAFYHTKIRQ